MPNRVSHGVTAGLAATAAVLLPLIANAAVYDLTVDRVTIDTGDFTRTGVGYNGASPGPVLRFQEGEEVTINVTNNLDTSTSIHWHGLILPADQDGVPNISFDGIDPGETFTYHFNMAQAGTYWYHSHTGFQEPDGAYGAIIIEPREREPFRYDREYVVQLTDSHPHDPERIMRNLKLSPDYYNRQQRTLVDLIRDAREDGLGAALSDRFAWGSMRMMPTDIEDVQGFVPLINGQGPEENWTGLFNPGERVRLRFINSSGMAYFDIRIPGLEMTVVQADGQNVQPVTVDELRIAVAETYDVIVRPTEDRAYTIFAESMGRTAYGRGTLAPRPGMTAEVPELREPPLLTMADMGMDHAGMGHGGMDHGSMQGMDHSAMPMPEGAHQMPDGTMMQGMEQPTMQMPEGAHQMPDGTTMEGMDHSTMPMPDGAHQMPEGIHQMPDGTTMPAMDHAATGESSKALSGATALERFLNAAPPAGGLSFDVPADAAVVALDRSQSTPSGAGQHRMPDGSAMAGMDHGSMATTDSAPFYAPGSGLTPTAAESGGKFLSYADLKAQKPLYPDREPMREIEVRLTGNMERYIWSVNGVKFEDAEPIRLRYGERVRFKFVNETMMSHPMHLHGMWSILDNGNGQWNPLKHTVSVAPGTTLYTETEVDAAGEWAFHCHLIYHAEAGMFRRVVVEGGPQGEHPEMQHDLTEVAG